MTPLHEAVDSDLANPEFVRTMVDVIVKANNWSLVDAVDKNKNTALHIAARRGRPEILAELFSLNPKTQNIDGDSPFHVAAKSGIPLNLETMIDIFNKPEKGVNIDQKNEAGETCLHICARRGNVQGVNVLIACGADLAAQNCDGNTVAHVIAEESVSEPKKKEQLLEVFRCVTSNATKWWCMKKDQLYPSEGSELHYSYMRTAMVQLTSQIYNNKRFNVVAFAITIGAVDMLEEILNTPNVYRFRETGEYLYDITNLIPQTNLSTLKKNVPGKKSSVGVLNSIEMSNKEPSFVATENSDNSDDNRTVQSCLDLVVMLEDDVLASRMLEINPIKQIVQNYWKDYQWIYVLLMIIHIVYMSLFTAYVMPNTTDLLNRYNFSSTNPQWQCKSDIGTTIYGLFLVWPGLIVLFEIVFMALRLFRASKQWLMNIINRDKTKTENKAENSQCCSCKIRIDVLEIPFLLLSVFISNLSLLSSFVFGATVAAWYVMYVCPGYIQAYVQVLSLAFLFGWAYTITFTKAFQGLHMFTIVLKHIIIRDITRFLLIYIVILLACGMAFNVLLQISLTITQDYSPTLWNTLFVSLNMMLGLGSLFDNNFDSLYATAGGSPGFVKCIYIFYIIIATVILMSLLVAMMTDTFTDIKAKEGTTWKVGSLRLALQLERSMPFIKQILKAMSIIRDHIVFDPHVERWMMPIDQAQVGILEKMESDEMIKTIQRLENKLDHVQSSYVELSRRMETALLSSSGVADGGEGSVAARTHRPVPSLYNVVNQIRERPFTSKGGRRKRD